METGEGLTGVKILPRCPRVLRRRPRADPGAFDCSGRGLPDGDVYTKFTPRFAREYEKVGLMKKRTAAKAGASSRYTSPASRVGRMTWF